MIDIEGTLRALQTSKIVAYGTADAGSDANTLADAARVEAAHYWIGITLLMLTGNNAGLSRGVYESAVGTLEVRRAFPNAIAAGDTYMLLSNYQRGDFACMDFWSEPQEEVAIPAAAADQALPDVVVTLPEGALPVHVYAFFTYRIVHNDNAAANALAGGQHIQVRDDTPGTWRNAISLVDNMFTLAANARESGGVLFGDHDIVIEVDGDDTYEFQWDEAVADLATLRINEVQTGLRIYYVV